MIQENTNMIHATTVIAVRRYGKLAIASDGQVTFGDTVLKGTANKVRVLQNGNIVAGFAGSVADAFVLLDLLKEKLVEHSGDLNKSVIEFAKKWRSDRHLIRLNAMLIVGDKNKLYLIDGSGNIIEPDDSAVAIGSGGNYAQSAALAYLDSSDFSAREIVTKSLKIASRICIYTNDAINVEEI